MQVLKEFFLSGFLPCKGEDFKVLKILEHSRECVGIEYFFVKQILEF